jgi:DNA-binding transcriptional MerR regulator
VDEGGVALAAIQGLNQKVEDRSQNSEVRIQKLETENADLKQQLAAMQKEMSSRLAVLEKAVARSAEKSAPTLAATTSTPEAK